MVFSSIPFLYFFLPLTLIVYALCPKKIKNAALLVFSLLFYWWGEPKYVLLMAFTVTFCYFAGIIIENRRTAPKGKLLLSFSVAVPLGLLALFKYADFLLGTVNSLTGADIPLLKLTLPIGISFYTFQAISYLIDVYRGDVPAQKNYISLATYITLFPQLIAGPIVRYTTVAEDLDSRKHTLRNISDGIFRFVIGLGKKVLIANLLGSFCTAYRESAEPSVVFAWLYAVSFALQIYFDFSAYSDMAIGMGKILGFRFLENFNYPFISKSITEFWRRWHISLGSWFRDYVYIPLGGNRVSAGRHIFNILVVWMFTGFWHGAAWNFIIWGLYFAVLLTVEKFFLGKFLKKSKVLAHVYTLFFVLISFVLFNAADMKTAVSDIGSLFGAGGLPLVSKEAVYYLRNFAVLFVCGIVGATPIVATTARKLFATDGANAEGKSRTWIAVSAVLETLFVVAMLVLVTAWLVDGSFSSFLYFRF